MEEDRRWDALYRCTSSGDMRFQDRTTKRSGRTDTDAVLGRRPPSVGDKVAERACLRGAVQCTVHSVPQTAQQTEHSKQSTQAGRECMLQRPRPSWLRMPRGLNVWVPHEARGFLCVGGMYHKHSTPKHLLWLRGVHDADAIFVQPVAPPTQSQVTITCTCSTSRVDISPTPSTHPAYEIYTEQRTVSQQ